ncbi:hypothetical protein JR334_07535 [Clostridia bacterium]|nr:hypothetical protein JR334_07535 [Clostridia bacterium]
MRAKIEEGKIIGYYIGLSDIKDCIDVPDFVATEPNRFSYEKGKFIEKEKNGSQDMKSLEQRVRELEETVTGLKGLQAGVKADA